jgi:hypothetical protein
VRRRAQSGVAIAVAALLAWATPTSAEEPPVPIPRQAELLVRVAAYDRNMVPRAAGKVRVLIVVKPDDADSRGTAAAMEYALSKFDKIAGLADEVSTVPFAGGAALAAACKTNHVSIVYVTPGLDAQIPDIVGALDGVDVLTAAAIPRFVGQGVVLGFDLVSAKPTLLINLYQAKRQNVAIEPRVVQLMKVIK